MTMENSLATRSLRLLLRVVAAAIFLVGGGSLIWYFSELSIRTSGWSHPTNIGQDVLVIVFSVGFATLISAAYLLFDNRIPRLLTVLGVVVVSICVLAFSVVLLFGMLHGV
jgi:hypothetical protein